MLHWLLSFLLSLVVSLVVAHHVVELRFEILYSRIETLEARLDFYTAPDSTDADTD